MLDATIYDTLVSLITMAPLLRHYTRQRKDARHATMPLRYCYVLCQPSIFHPLPRAGVPMPPPAYDSHDACHVDFHPLAFVDRPLFRQYYSAAAMLTLSDMSSDD